MVVRLPAPVGIVVDPGDGHRGGGQHALLAAAALVVDGDGDVGVEGARGAGVVGRRELHVVQRGVGLGDGQAGGRVDAAARPGLGEAAAADGAGGRIGQRDGQRAGRSRRHPRR